MRWWALNEKKRTFAVLLIIHDSGDLMALERSVFVGVLCLFDEMDFLASFLCLPDGLVPFGTMLERSGKDGITLLLHFTNKKNYATVSLKYSLGNFIVRFSKALNTSKNQNNPLSITTSNILVSLNRH